MKFLNFTKLAIENEVFKINFYKINWWDIYKS